MSEQAIMYVMMIAGGLFMAVIVAYLIISKRNNNAESKYIRQLRAGTKEKKFSMEMLYQKLYVKFIRFPGIKRYTLKLRRRLEIINIDDEYTIRKQTAKIITNALLIIIPLTIVIIAFTKDNFLLLSILLVFELLLIETVIEGLADKVDNKLLKQQIDFFAEMRHAYHEFNMVEEAIYEVAQNDELEVSRQAEKIYEILISSDPESELEKYYDIAPNAYLKEFAGVSYLTKEFGDRTVDEGSLYLKNVNNITQEMQLEILKRDKLDYVFQSLSVIAAVPVVCIQPIKDWSLSQFSFTDVFYDGKLGLIAQILIVIITFVCYILIRKLKDNGTGKSTQNTENPWQSKVYKNKIGKKIVDVFLPKKGTKEYRKITNLLKDSASKLKMEWLYVNRLSITVLAFVVSLLLFQQTHKVAIDMVYTEPTTDLDIIGMMSENDKKKGMEITEQDNYFLDRFRGKINTTKEQIELSVRYSEYYAGATDEEISEAAERIYGKLQIINSEQLQWFELLMAMAFAVIGYYGPVWIMIFQKKMRQMEMENEVMQFQTIILMLMKIERVNVEIILEWLERYSNIFREPITKCVNNYEAGSWEALEELKNDVSYPQFIRLVESMQAAVEKIPIQEAFDELDTERAYYQDKRKDSNDRLIARKGLIGKAIGFTPMIVLFVGYLIAPLVVIGLLSMTSSFSTMSSLM